MIPTFDLNQIITHLKAVPQTRSAFKYVGGAMDFAAHQGNGARTEIPAAYVLAGGDLPP